MAHPRSGYSRLELGIAGAIAAILVGLCVPAVQKLRVASDRARCGNNLRSLGAGIRSYHDAKKHLPPGGHHTPPASSARLDAGCRESEWSWAFHLLPHLGFYEVFANPDADAVRAAEVPHYVCSARRRTGRRWNNRTMLDYAANAGTQPNGTDGAIQRSTEKPYSWSDFPNGLGGTLMLAEKRLNVAEFGNAPGDRHGFATPGWSEACEAHRFGIQPPAADFDSPGDCSPLTEFGSSHPGVLLALFADGTVRTIRVSVSPSVWRRACVRNDDQRLNVSELP